MESSGVQPSHSILCPPWCETRPLEANVQNREQPKVTRSEIQTVRWLGDDRNAFLGEELPHNKRCVARCVIVMQKPLGTNLALTSLIFQIVGQNRMNGSVTDASVLFQLHDGHSSIILNQLSHFFNQRNSGSFFDCPTYVTGSRFRCPFFSCVCSVLCT